MPGTTSFSNQAEVAAWLIDGIDSFGFDAPSGGTTLGEAIVENHVQQIQERSFGEQRGADAPWPANSEPYATEKFEEFGSYLINVRTRQMLSRESLRGRATADKREILHTYGTGEAGDSNAGRKPRKDGKPRKDRAVEPTDVDKATWADDQQRQFFELDDQIRDKNADLVADALAEHLRNR
jgi:hypothetical protein